MTRPLATSKKTFRGLSCTVNVKILRLLPRYLGFRIKKIATHYAVFTRHLENINNFINKLTENNLQVFAGGKREQ